MTVYLLHNKPAIEGAQRDCIRITAYFCPRCVVDPITYVASWWLPLFVQARTSRTLEPASILDLFIWSAGVLNSPSTQSLSHFESRASQESCIWGATSPSFDKSSTLLSNKHYISSHLSVVH